MRSVECSSIYFARSSVLRPLVVRPLSQLFVVCHEEKDHTHRQFRLDASWMPISEGDQMARRLLAPVNEEMTKKNVVISYLIRVTRKYLQVLLILLANNYCQLSYLFARATGFDKTI